MASEKSYGKILMTQRDTLEKFYEGTMLGNDGKKCPAMQSTRSQQMKMVIEQAAIKTGLPKARVEVGFVFLYNSETNIIINLHQCMTFIRGR